MTCQPPFSVIIPAHNEESVIVRCLESMLKDAPAGQEPEIIVVCNGCTDRTAERARAVDPNIEVIELQTGSKPLALNTGNARATAVPRLFVDADIVVSYRALSAVADVLRDGEVMAAAPALHADLTGCDWVVRAFFSVWLTQPYVLDGMVGSGIIGLSEKGLKAVGEFPPIIADDGYVRTRFPSSQRRRVDRDAAGAPVQFTMFAPRTVWDLIRVDSRQRAGNIELAQRFGNAQTSRSTTGASLLSAPIPLVSKAAYLGVKSAGRLRFGLSKMRGRHDRWKRDESSRRQ